MAETRKEKPSCGYQGKKLTEDMLSQGPRPRVIGVEGECEIARCVNGLCWFLVSNGYQPCPKCSAPDIEPVIKNPDTPPGESVKVLEDKIAGLEKKIGEGATVAEPVEEKPSEKSGSTSRKSKQPES